MSQTSSQWLLFAIMSGACAALNGVFAKLTTTEVTTSWAQTFFDSLGWSGIDAYSGYLARGFFLGLNFTFNAVMWTLFTKALKLTSTLHVSVINTSANFILTAVLSSIIFGERLPPLWWLGAAFLVTGSVIIGRRVQDEHPKATEAKEKKS